VRSLARDLGRALGLPAHLAALRRTLVGPFGAGVPPDDVAWEGLVASAEIVAAAGLTWVDLAPDDARAFVAGGAVRAPDLRPGRAACGVRTDGMLVGLGLCTEPGQLRPKVVLSSARAALSK